MVGVTKTREHRIKVRLWSFEGNLRGKSFKQRAVGIWNEPSEEVVKEGTVLSEGPDLKC